MNKVMLIGNVGREPEVRYYDADQACAMFPLATSERGYTLPNGTKVPESTDWHNIVVWRRLAKVVERYVHKGDKLYVEGKIKTRHYTDKRGMDRVITEIYVDNLELLSPRVNNHSGQDGNSEELQRGQATASVAEESTQHTASAAGLQADNDLPF